MQLSIELSMTNHRKKNAFLYVIGKGSRNIYNTMTLAEDATDKITVLFAKFKTYYKPKQNVTIEKYHFNTRVQSRSETIDQYIINTTITVRKLLLISLCFYIHVRLCTVINDKTQDPVCLHLVCLHPRNLELSK